MGESIIPCQYTMAHPYNANGEAIVKTDNGYYTIDRKGTIVRTYAFDEMIPDGLWLRVRQDKQWGWCNEKGGIAITPQFEGNRPFGESDFAPVKIRGKWGYIDRQGNVAIKRQFTEAFPFVDKCAAVKTGTVWGFINTEGRFVINPQYDYIPQDYLYQALGLGCAHSTLNIE